MWCCTSCMSTTLKLLAVGLRPAICGCFFDDVWC